MSEDFLKRAESFVSDAAIDTAADGYINNAVDGVASRVPGGANFETMAKTGIDLAANNAINAEVAKVEGMFGHAAPAAPPSAAAEPDVTGDQQQGDDVQQ